MKSIIFRKWERYTARILSLALLVGTVFAFYTVYKDFSYFYYIEGSLTKIQNCAIPNPVTTPCFYGAFGFLIACIWSIELWKVDIPIKAQKYFHLIWFLVAGTIFAWSNYFYSIRDLFRKVEEPVIGCSGHIVTNPFTTACFIGSVLFLLSLIVAGIHQAILRKR